MVRIPGYCCHDPETTVLAHLGGGGMGMKQNDLFAAWTCIACHDVLDGRRRTEHSPDEKKLLHLEGVIRTQEALLDEGIISY
jgi:hypothetical protein